MEKRKYVIARCPHCNYSIMYSDDPQDKNTVKVYPVGADYKGKTHLCSKCKKMYAVVDPPPHYVILPIVQGSNSIFH